MSYLSSLLSDVIQTFYHLIGSYGWAIIVVSAILRILVAPAQHYQILSMRRMKEIEPLRKAIEKRYKGDPKRIQEETMRLYRAHKVNPMAGCLPMLVQIPILWGFFTALRNLHYLGPANFAWIANLAQPDPWILPILAGVTTFFQSKLTTPPTSQNDSTSLMLLYMMPLFIIWVSRQFPAGLALYWVVSNVLSIVQQLVVPPGGRRPLKEEAS